MTNKEEILKKPIEQLGLSVGAYNFLIKLGFYNINNILSGGELEYDLLNKRLRTTTLSKCTNEQQKIECQKYYNEIVNYLREQGFKIIDKKTILEPFEFVEENSDKEKELIRKISKKLICYCNVESTSECKILEEVAINTVDLKIPIITPLNQIETSVMRIMCGLYTSGKEQTLEKTSIILEMDEKQVGSIFYQALHKIKFYVDERERQRKNNIKIKTI